MNIKCVHCGCAASMDLDDDRYDDFVDRFHISRVEEDGFKLAIHKECMPVAIDNITRSIVQLQRVFCGFEPR